MFEIESFKGIIPPIATPLKPEERVDAKGMRNLIDYLLDLDERDHTLVGRRHVLI